MNYIGIFAAAFWFHLVADFPLQGDFLANMKGKYDFLLAVHCAIWTGAICAVLWWVGILAVWKVVMLFGVHFILDRYKARKEDKEHALTADLWVDQLGHAVQIATAVLL